MEKITMSEIARKVGISRQRIHQIISGKKIITAETYIDLIKAIPELKDCFEPVRYRIIPEKYKKLKAIVKIEAKKQEIAELEELLKGE